MQQELCRHTHGEPGTAGPLHWDPEPQRDRKVSAEDKKKLNRGRAIVKLEELAADVCGQGCLLG